ncbi:MAG: hypothetical protein WD077_12730 [Bacteroidia bacterium]
MIRKKVKTVKGLVKQLRSIRDKMNAELADMTPEQRTEYFRKMRERSSAATSPLGIAK